MSELRGIARFVCKPGDMEEVLENVGDYKNESFIVSRTIKLTAAAYEELRGDLFSARGWIREFGKWQGGGNGFGKEGERLCMLIEDELGRDSFLIDPQGYSYPRYVGIIQSISKSPRTKFAWTYVYEPFRLGGALHHPVGAEFEVGDKHDIGGGYFGYEIHIGDIKRIIEAQSGAIIGDSLESVRYDIERAADSSFMAKQVKRAISEAGEAKVLSLEEFTALYLRGGRNG